MPQTNLNSNMQQLIEFLKSESAAVTSDLLRLFHAQETGDVMDISVGDIADALNDHLPVKFTNDDLVLNAQKAVVIYTILMNKYDAYTFDSQAIRESLDGLQVMCDSVRL